MRSFTYGNSEAARILDELLEGDNWSSRRVSSFYNSFTKGMKHINCIKDETIKVSIERLWVAKHRESVNNSKLSHKIKNYLTNIMVGYYRDIMEQRRNIIENERQKIQDEKRKAKEDGKKTQTVLDVRIT